MLEKCKVGVLDTHVPEATRGGGRGGRGGGGGGFRLTARRAKCLTDHPRVPSHLPACPATRPFSQLGTYASRGSRYRTPECLARVAADARATDPRRRRPTRARPRASSAGSTPRTTRSHAFVHALQDVEGVQPGVVHLPQLSRDSPRGVALLHEIRDPVLPEDQAHGRPGLRRGHEGGARLGQEPVVVEAALEGAVHEHDVSPRRPGGGGGGSGHRNRPDRRG